MIVEFSRRSMVLELTAAWALALSSLGPVHPIGSADVFGRCLRRSPLSSRLRMGIAEKVGPELCSPAHANLPNPLRWST